MLGTRGHCQGGRCQPVASLGAQNWASEDTPHKEYRFLIETPLSCIVMNVDNINKQLSFCQSLSDVTSLTSQKIL